MTRPTPLEEVQAAILGFDPDVALSRENANKIMLAIEAAGYVIIERATVRRLALARVRVADRQPSE